MRFWLKSCQTCCWLTCGELSPCLNHLLAAVPPSPAASVTGTNKLYLGSAWRCWSTKHCRNKKSLSQKCGSCLQELISKPLVWCCPRTWLCVVLGLPRIRDISPLLYKCMLFFSSAWSAPPVGHICLKCSPCLVLSFPCPSKSASWNLLSQDSLFLQVLMSRRSSEHVSLLKPRGCKSTDECPWEE